MNVSADLCLFVNNFLKKTKMLLLCIVIMPTFLGLPSINAQEIDTKDENTLKPLVLIGGEVFSLDKYCNNRFDYCVAYPKDLFDNRKKPANNDGRTWISEDGDMRLTVYGTNSLNWSLEEEHKQWRQMLETDKEEDTRLKTNVLTDTYFELAGVVDGMYYYQKTHLNEEKDQFITLIFRSMRNPIENKHIKDLRETITDSFVIQ